MGLVLVGAVATTFYISTTSTQKNNESVVTNTQIVEPISKVLNKKEPKNQEELISEEAFVEKIKIEKELLEKNFKNSTKPNSWKIFRRTKVIQNIQSASGKNTTDLQKEFKTGNLKIRTLLYIQETPSSWTNEQNKEYYSEQTQKWSDQISKKLTNLLRIEHSKFSPFVNFIFKDFNGKEKNLDVLQNENRIKAAFSYEDIHVETAWDWTLEDLIKDENKRRAEEKEQQEYIKDTQSVFKQIFINAGLQKQWDIDRKNKYKLKRVKIGIIESSDDPNRKKNKASDDGYAFVNENLNTFSDTKINKLLLFEKAKNSHHGSLVAAIAAGKNGVNIRSEIYSANLNNGLEYAMEWMISNGVKIINHSYAKVRRMASTNFLSYDENVYYMDFLARKYGLINIYAAGNNAAKQYNILGWELSPNLKGNNFPKINGNQLSINSIIVGGLNKDSKEKSDFSQYGVENLGNDYLDELPKPLISIDSEGFDLSVIPGYSKRLDNEKGKGTSLAAPVITGAVSLIMRDYKNVDRPEEVMAILAASATKLDISLSDDSTANGLDPKVGAGKLNFQNLKIAAKNLKSFFVWKDSPKLVNADEIYLSKGQKINASIAWLYNAGFFRNKLIKKSQISKKEGFDNLKSSRLFSDYDIQLKYFNEVTRNWNYVDGSASGFSNVELFRYQVAKSGKYKLEVIKYSDNSEYYPLAPSDRLAISYVILN